MAAIGTNPPPPLLGEVGIIEWIPDRWPAPTGRPQSVTCMGRYSLSETRAALDAEIMRRGLVTMLKFFFRTECFAKNRGTRCMRLLRIVHYSLCYLVLVSLSLPALVAQVSMLTQHNDNSRPGQNLQETILNTSTVNVANFGKLFSLPVTGNIFAQPLYVPGVTISGATHNVVYVATAENYVYAFDADSGNTNPLWVVGQNALGTPVPSQDICVTDEVECPYTDVMPWIGI